MSKRSPPMLAMLMLATGALSLAGCGTAGGDSAAAADNELASNDSDDSDDEEQLATAAQCAVQLEAVAKLPAAETQSQVTEENAPPEAAAAEHASLAQLYRGQVTDIAQSLGKSAADVDMLYKQASEEIERQRKARAPDDFAGWLGGEADDCPAISPDGSS